MVYYHCLLLNTGKLVRRRPATYIVVDHAGSTKQVAAAVGEGATAALMIRQYLEPYEGNRGYKGD